MIKSLTINGYYVDFSQVNPVQFNMGVSLITGPNGSGKSSIMEMIRFALFGSKALRRPASDYKKLDVTLEFEVRGKAYKVLRTPGQTLLKDAEGTPLAVGTTPVNSAITGLFGYGLTVFDIANCCNQNQVMAFSDRMQPGDRKKLIDQTVGLAAIDDLALELNNEAVVLGREVTFLTQRVESGKPEAPRQPVPFRSLEEVRQGVQEAQEAQTAIKVIRSNLDRLNLTPPIAPELPEGFPKDFDVEKCRSLILTLQGRVERRTFLRGLTKNEPTAPQYPVAPDISFSDDELQDSIDNREKLRSLKDRLGMLRRPSMTQAEIVQGKAQLALWNDFLAAEKLRKQGEAECPACGHHFPNAHKALEHYSHVPAEMAQPAFTSDYLAGQEALLGNISISDDLNQQIAAIPALIDNDQRLLKTLAQYRVELAQANKAAETYQQERDLYEAHLQEMELYKNAPEALKHNQDLMDTYDQYLRKQERHQERLQVWGDNKAEETRLLNQIPALAALEAQLLARQASLEEHLTYQTAYNAYTKRLEDWQADSDKLAQVSAEYADLKAGRAALLDLKVKIKSYLLPSLNMVATSLISEMTGGVLSKLALTDDFEILVDDTPIAAMSGSEQAVANLALRLALGQVLTNRVFSVFMGDELDASMDQDRASYLMECLFRLRNQIGQILLVTHKQFEADHTVQLKRRK